MLPIDLRGKRAFIAGVADDAGFGFAIAKSLAEAGASVCVGTWPPALGIFEKLLERGKMGESMRLTIDMVGYDLGFSIGTCGKDAQGVPVTDAMPTIRIPEMVVGGSYE